MSVTSTRTVNITYLGDGFNASDSFPAATNTTSPAQVLYRDLASGSNTISTTTGVTAVTILPPATNTNSITLKGVSGDTGVRIHNTDPTSIAVDPSVSSFVLTAGTTIAGVKMVFT